MDISDESADDAGMQNLRADLMQLEGNGGTCDTDGGVAEAAQRTMQTKIEAPET